MTASIASIAFLGTGLLGSGFARALHRRGERVTVWNRTHTRALPLAAEGITVCEDAAEAVRGATRIHLSLSDDAAVDDSLERARVAPGQVIVDHTTTSVAGTRERAARWASRGIEFLHAPVFMGPQNALDGTGVMLVSGDRARIFEREDALAPELQKMTGKLVYVGAEPERAAAFKLSGNLFLMFLTTGMIEMISFARAVGIAPADAVSLFESFNPGQTLHARAKRILDAAYDKPSWELAMARKDARLMLEDAGDAVHILPAIAAEMDRWIARGMGKHDWTVMASDAIDASLGTRGPTK